MSESAIPNIDALLCPSSIAIVGASDRSGSWSRMVYDNLKRFDFPGAVYAINPRAEEMWGGPCYASIDTLPAPPDHLVIMVPAPLVPDILRTADHAGTRSATVFSGGFIESEDAAAGALRSQLMSALAETDIALSGPNCFGTVAARSRLVTLADTRLQSIAPGPVAILGQSGGVLTALQRRLSDRAIGWGYLITSGDEFGVTTADYIAYLAGDPDIKVIVCFSESLRNADRFLESCRVARATGKHVVVIKMGGSDAGRAAALAHTGSLAGTLEAFDAATADVGVIRATTLNEMVETTEYLCRQPRPKGSGIGAIAFSGGLKGLLVEAAARQGYSFPDLTEESLAALAKVLGPDAPLGNPLDSGFAGVTNQEIYFACIDIIARDPAVDLVMLQEELPRGPGSASKEANLRKVQERIQNDLKMPLAFFSMVSHDMTDYSRELRAQLPDVAFLQEVDTSLRTVRSVVERAERTFSGGAHSHIDADYLHRLRPSAGQGPRALSEPESKKLLLAFGIVTPEEAIATTEDEAAAAAACIGFPVVLKVISSQLTHKSDIGGVVLGLADEKAVRHGYRQLLENVNGAAPDAQIDGVLIAQQIDEGLEVVIGIQNDPEVGPVVMFGGGGVWLELFKDVAFAAPPIDRANAEAMIDRTKVGQLLRGYRGGTVYDTDALATALISVGSLAANAGEALESVDINPLLVRPTGQSVCALDALFVLRAHD